VPNVKELNDMTLREAHKFSYSIHPGGNKIVTSQNFYFGM
jgi:hypothetical protein